MGFPFLGAGGEDASPSGVFTRLFIILLLIFLNGFFVASEFALVKVRSSQLDLLEEEGNRRASRRSVGNASEKARGHGRHTVG